MVTLPRLKRLWESLMALGAYPGETDVRRGKRRIVVGFFFFGALTRVFAVAIELAEGVPGEAVVDLSAGIIAVLFLGLLQLKPDWFLWIVNAALFLILVEVLSATIILGGLVPSELVILFGLLAVIGALIVLSVRSAYCEISALRSATHREVRGALSRALSESADSPRDIRK